MNNDYNKQVLDFLTKTGTTLEVCYNRFDFYFTGDKQKRDVWNFRLKRGAREYIAEFGSSIKDREDLLKKFFPNESPQYAEKLLATEGRLMDIRDEKKRLNYNKAIRALMEWQATGDDRDGLKPTAYSILACLDFYFFTDIDDFSEEFGYNIRDTKPSELLKIYNSVQKQNQALKELFNDDELELLADIN